MRTPLSTSITVRGKAQKVGGGSGGGVVGATPAGYVEITDTATRYVSVSPKRQLLYASLAGVTAGLSQTVGTFVGIVLQKSAKLWIVPTIFPMLQIA
jgi:hypothetical protein